MEASGKGFLKVAGIILIVIGAIALLGGLLTVFSAAVSSSMSSTPEYQQAMEAYGVSISSEEMAQMMQETLIIGIKTCVLSLINLIAGILAVRGCGRLEKAKSLRVFGIIIVILNGANMLYSITTGIVGVILPLICVILSVFYIMGASRNLQESRLADNETTASSENHTDSL